MQNKPIKNIAIIGCGWLGFPLAKTLIERGFIINGSTTKSEKIVQLKESGIVPFLIHLDGDKPTTDFKEFLGVDLLIINIPPGRGSGDADSYLNKLNSLKSEVLKSPVKKIIFISSTSVYAENNAVHTEDSEDLGKQETALRMLHAENVFPNLVNIETTIIRMGGLIGPARHPGRFFAGKNDIPNGLSPVNLIHLDDCIGIIHKVITDNLWNEVFNGVAPSHPSKMEFYGLASKVFSDKQAGFIAEKGSYKVISPDKIINKGYIFKHPDLMGLLSQESKFD